MCLMLAASYTEPNFLQWLLNAAWIVLGIGAGLTFVIFVHELGHFLVAKACGVKCEKFYVGFDFFEFKLGPLKIPRALVKFQWGETEYGLGSLPLGGYVKMLGQDDDPRNAEAEAERIKAVKEGTAAEGLVTGQTTAGEPIALDPRSYPAKPIPARMAIISAGVIMNLIFGVILGAAAYKIGVNEKPAVIGGTSPGSIPWKLGIQPGSKAVAIGENASKYEYIRWDDFLFTAVLHEDLEVPVLFRAPDGQETWFNLKPTKIRGAPNPMLGLIPPQDLQVNIFPGFAPQLNPVATPPLEDYDVVIEAAGQQVTSAADLYAIFARHPLGEMTIKVERPASEDRQKRRNEWQHEPQVIEAVLAPRPVRELGLTVKHGPIVAIREDSPAMRAGLQVDDLLVEIDGQPIGDPLSLTQRLTPQSSMAEEITVTVERPLSGGKSERKSFQVTPEIPLRSLSLFPTNPISVEPLGIAFRLTDEVATVAPGGPAAKAGLQRGDKLTRVDFLLGGDNATAEKLKSVHPQAGIDEITFAQGGTWTEVVYQLQSIFPDSTVKLSWTRGDKAMTAAATPRDSQDFFDDTRGIQLYGLKVMRVASNWGDAFALGFRETKEKLLQTLLILRRLVTFRLSPTNLSGPAGIIWAAGNFANRGLSDLLLFLVLLSANLAILNFLPIPALDGGHMLFLTAEAIRGKPVDEKLQMRLTMVGVLCLLSLMVFATAMDIGRFAQMFMQ